MRDEQEWKSRNPEPVLQNWPFQDAITLLITSGFVHEGEDTTQAWKLQSWRDGKAFYHPYYVWTPEGKDACFRSAYTTPMSWAGDIHAERTRHCIACGRDCYRKKVWAHDGAFRCVCMTCGATGHRLSDLKEIGVECGQTQ